MLVEFLATIGPWNWIILGCVLLALEIVVPGFYLLWIGIAALLTGTLSFQLMDVALWTWQAQTVFFLGLSLATALIGRRVFSGGGEDTDQPLLNRREQQMIGTVATLEEPIQDGRGRVRIGDSLWQVAGPDLPAGTRIRVTNATNGILSVEPV
ncbi:MAG: NfeD family protein [Mesorhizobium sp.]|nr:NfeD family protein [Mesorhizobium sp.]